MQSNCLAKADRQSNKNIIIYNYQLKKQTNEHETEECTAFLKEQNYLWCKNFWKFKGVFYENNIYRSI